MVNYVLGMSCVSCGEERSVDDMYFRCKKCNEPLEVNYDLSKLGSVLDIDSFKKRTWDVWRYHELLPINDKLNMISLMEGGTPLIKSTSLAEELGIKELYLKDETRNPTWSYKDRGTAVGVSKAIEVHAEAVAAASTGNMGSSLSAYSAKAGIKCVILITAATPIEKVVQILIHGANTIAVDQPYPGLYRMLFEMSEKYRVYLVHSDSPMRVEGQKTAAFEICEQLGWITPDKVIIPTSSGGNISAYWKGFRELSTIKLIDRVPNMVSIQAAGCAPIVKAFKEGKESPELWPSPETVAHSISNPNPVVASGRRCLNLLRESSGIAEDVSDSEILSAQKLLATTEGLFAEPAAAASIAGLKKLINNGYINDDERVVCVITGAGLKDVKSALKNCVKPSNVKTRDELWKALSGYLQ